MRGIVAYGAYLPYWRLERKAIGDALGVSAGGGTRAVASYDEDTTSLAVEAARAALRGLRRAPEVLYFATSDPAYLDKTNANAIHAALDLPATAMAVDMVGSVRSAAGALRVPLGSASATAEFLDRWRLPGEAASHQWEERFGEATYVPLGESALAEALKQAGVTAQSLTRLIVAGPHGRAARRVAAGAGATKDAIGDDLTTVVGNTGAAHAGLLFADALDRAKPDELIAVVSLADGADVTVWKTTNALANRTMSPTVADQIASAKGRVAYNTWLTWRGFLRREPPRRPDPQPPEAPPSFRSEAWKFAFTGSRCQVCGTRHLPPQRVCVKCQAIDRMTPERMADVSATIATFTIDRLAFSPSPPMVAAVIDFEGGGRYQCELTDVDPKTVAIGNRVEMTFRRLLTAGSVHNYFWKPRPIRHSS